MHEFNKTHRTTKLAPIFGLPLVCAVWLLSACATQPTPSIERKYYGPWEKDIGYAQALKIGDRLYISGVTSQAASFNGQLTEDYAYIAKVLADFGVDSKAIIKETIYTRDLEALKKAIPLRKQFYGGDNYPSASWVQVERLFDEAQKVEIEVEVWLPQK